MESREEILLRMGYYGKTRKIYCYEWSIMARREEILLRMVYHNNMRKRYC